MEIKKSFNPISALLMLMMTIVLTGCPDPDPIEPSNNDNSITDGIIGKWLLATSTDLEWTTYDFKKTRQVESEWFVNNALITSAGTFFTNDEKASLTAALEDGRGNHIYLDWVATKVQTYQIDFNAYSGPDGNNFLYASSLYKIVGEETPEYGASFTPEYFKYTGSKDCSGFLSLNETIATVNSDGQIASTGEGVTYVTFNTPAGRAAIKITVAGKKTPLSEYIMGAWVTDIHRMVCEKDVFAQDGYFFGQWSRQISFSSFEESAQGSYAVDEKNNIISVTATTPYDLTLNVEYHFKKMDKYSFVADLYSEGDMTGEFYYQRILSSISLDPKQTALPNYLELVDGLEILAYASHNEDIAVVDEKTGQITGVSRGIAYIDVATNQGNAVIEVNVSGGVIPFAFEEYLGQPTSKFEEKFGEPYYKDDEMIIYTNITDEIYIVGATYDSFSGIVNYIVVQYNENVNTSDVTSILDAIFIPFVSQTTDTFKAYMDSEKRADATIGVTWDIPSRTLTYVNLATDLFVDYSVLLKMTRPEVISKMGREPDSSNDQSQSFFFFDNKGVRIVSAYYTDFVENFDTVRSVVTMFDDTLTVDQITTYLKKKYPYYPEYSTEEELVFIPVGHKMEIFYLPKDKMIMYILVPANNKDESRASVVAKLKSKAKSMKR